MDNLALNREVKAPIKDNSAHQDDSQNNQISPSQLYEFFIDQLAFDPKTNAPRDRVSMKNLVEFVPTSQQETAAIRQLRENFSAIKNLSYDEWGVETVITTKDMSELAKRGLPDAAQRVREAPTWRSLNEAIRVDPDYFPNKAKAARLQTFFNANRELIDLNNDNEISVRELKIFEQSRTIDNDAKYMAKVFRENFQTLSQDTRTIPSKALSTLEMQLSPQSTEIDGILRGIHGAGYLVPSVALACLTAFAAAKATADKFYPSSSLSTKLAKPPIRTSLLIGAISGVALIVESELVSFDRYKNQHATLMPMLSNINFERN